MTKNSNAKELERELERTQNRALEIEREIFEADSRTILKFELSRHQVKELVKIIERYEDYAVIERTPSMASLYEALSQALED